MNFLWRCTFDYTTNTDHLLKCSHLFHLGHPGVEQGEGEDEYRVVWNSGTRLRPVEGLLEEKFDKNVL